jgi:hypothetical protein
MFVFVSVSNKARLAAITGVGTVAACAASKEAATAAAWAAAFSVWLAAVLSHAVYGAAVAAIATAAGPCHVPPDKFEVTEPNESAAARNSPANPLHADEAASMGADPAPACISAELISGGKQG